MTGKRQGVKPAEKKGVASTTRKMNPGGQKDKHMLSPNESTTGLKQRRRKKTDTSESDGSESDSSPTDKSCEQESGSDGSESNSSGSNASHSKNKKPTKKKVVKRKIMPEPKINPDTSKGRKKNEIILEILFSIFVITIALLYFNDSNDAHRDFCDPYKSKNCSHFLKQQVEHLSKKYENQPPRLWQILRSAAALHVVFDPEPQRPIVIMAYNCHDRLIIKETIYDDISSAYQAVLSPNRRRGSIEINCGDFVGMESDAVQEHIMTAFEDGYEKKGKRVAMVHNFDLLPSCSILIFHNLCNNDDAPYKDMAIILTVTGDKKDAEVKDSKILEQIISQKFQDQWKDCPDYLPADKIDAIMSRVSNNVVVLK